jgi:hypothetical protein
VGLGKKQDSGFRCQVAGARAGAMLNCELWIVSCLLTSRHRLLPTAFEELAARFGRSAPQDKMSHHAWRKNRSKFKK